MFFYGHGAFKCTRGLSNISAILMKMSLCIVFLLEGRILYFFFLFNLSVEHEKIKGMIGKFYWVSEFHCLRAYGPKSFFIDELEKNDKNYKDKYKITVLFYLYFFSPLVSSNIRNPREKGTGFHHP